MGREQQFIDVVKTPERTYMFTKHSSKGKVSFYACGLDYEKDEKLKKTRPQILRDFVAEDKEFTISWFGEGPKQLTNIIPFDQLEELIAAQASDEATVRGPNYKNTILNPDHPDGPRLLELKQLTDYAFLSIVFQNAKGWKKGTNEYSNILTFNHAFAPAASKFASVNGEHDQLWLTSGTGTFYWNVKGVQNSKVAPFDLLSYGIVDKWTPRPPRWGFNFDVERLRVSALDRRRYVGDKAFFDFFTKEKQFFDLYGQPEALDPTRKAIEDRVIYHHPTTQSKEHIQAYYEKNAQLIHKFK